MVKGASPYFRGFTRPQGAFTEAAMGTGAAHLKFLHDKRRIPSGTSNGQAAPES
jgi:hypothetical protein